MGDQLQLALSTGRILLLNAYDGCVSSPTELKGHMDGIYCILPISGRILPRHWLPSIIGRSNVIDYYRDLLSEEDIQQITSSMIGRQCRLLVSIGHGFYGVAGKVVEPLMSSKDCDDNFVLLWSVSH